MTVTLYSTKNIGLSSSVAIEKRKCICVGVRGWFVIFADFAGPTGVCLHHITPIIHRRPLLAMIVSILNIHAEIQRKP